MVTFMNTVNVFKCDKIIEEINSSIKDNTSVFIENGIYHIYPDECTVRNFKITNSLPQYQCDEFDLNYDHNAMIMIENKKNVIINGQGSKFICHGKMTPVYASGSENIKLCNITVDYADPTVAEMEVLEIGDGYYIVKIHPDTKYRIEDEKIVWYGENFEFYDTKHYFHQYYPKDDCMRKFGFGPMRDVTARYKELGNRVVKISFDSEKFNPYNFVVGGIVQLRDGIRDECGSFFGNCKDVVLDNITMHFMHGLGIVSQCSENITINRLTCAPDSDSGRICSCFADGSQFSNCRGQINITNCIFRGLHDDPINIHGTYMRIVKSSGKTITARFIQPDTFDINIFRKGDTIEARDSEYMLAAAQARVENAELLNPYDIEITLDRDATNFKEGLVVENVSANPDVHISGCHSSRVTTKGFLTSTRGKVIIENNTFVNFRRPCVLLACDTATWYESGPVKDVTIRNNTHINCTEQNIYIIKPENTKFSNTEFVQNNILIENNRAEGAPNSWLYAKSTDNLIFRNNTADFNPLPPEIIGCGKIIYE